MSGTYQVGYWDDDESEDYVCGRRQIRDWQASQDEIIDQIEAAKEDAFDVLLLLVDLTAKQRFVIERRYGVHDGYVYSQEELGSVMGISQQAVNQIEVAALRKLKNLVK